jgi:hypothetical protein
MIYDTYFVWKLTTTEMATVRNVQVISHKYSIIHTAKWLHTVFGRSRDQIYARRPAILTDISRSFPQSLEANA